MNQTAELSALPACGCGCGAQVTRPGNLFLKGHSRRLRSDTFPFCACGCGGRVGHPLRRWIRGHSSRKYCACGCGGIAPPHHQFIQNHHKTKERPLCACGCGERVSGPSRRYLKGHSTRHRNNGTFGPTLHEQMVQIALQKRGRAFLFNIPIEGQYRPDFRFPEARLILEIDGDSHRIPTWQRHEEERERLLNSLGYCILHWTNEQVESELDALVAHLEAVYQARVAPGQSSPDDPPV
jgi:very-short-patch-repair endonuclease